MTKEEYIDGATLLVILIFGVILFLAVVISTPWLLMFWFITNLTKLSINQFEERYENSRKV